MIYYRQRSNIGVLHCANADVTYYMHHSDIDALN